ncbi:MAG: DsbE family thiol:disulfide interchange protein [Gammaproteobacteria bacterium]|nr:DsbE family thiol:disulfide interchange protein [Gammaproteobacteria bacterium]
MKKFLIPIIAFVAIGVLLYIGLSLNPRHIPSPLIGKPLGEFSLPTVHDESKMLGKKDLLGRVYLLNVWASWCVACRQEHPLLMEVQRQNLVPIIGVDNKDERADALAFLQQMGNPYEQSVADRNGRFSIDLGVYGVPESFVIDKNGMIRYKHIGPIDQQSLFQTILPLVHKLRQE